MTFAIPQFWRHKLTVQRLTGSGPRGDIFSAATVHLGWVKDSRQLVAAADGEQVISETTVYLPIDTTAVPVGSKVTLPASYDGRTARVLVVSRHDSAGLGTLDHLELALT